MRINICLFDNHNINESDYESDYKSEIDEHQVNEISLSEYIAESISRDYEDTMDNIRSCNNNLCECVVIGSLGLWYGRVQTSKKFTCLYEAVRACANNMNDIIIRQVNGHIEMECYHHDGTNKFSIHLLNGKGQSTYGDLTNKRYHQAIKGYIF